MLTYFGKSLLDCMLPCAEGSEIIRQKENQTRSARKLQDMEGRTERWEPSGLPAAGCKLGDPSQGPVGVIRDRDYSRNRSQQFTVVEPNFRGKNARPQLCQQTACTLPTGRHMSGATGRCICRPQLTYPLAYLVQTGEEQLPFRRVASGQAPTPGAPPEQFRATIGLAYFWHPVRIGHLSYLQGTNESGRQLLRTDEGGREVCKSPRWRRRG
jgi:hypothetical protein